MIYGHEPAHGFGTGYDHANAVAWLRRQTKRSEKANLTNRYPHHH